MNDQLIHQDSRLNRIPIEGQVEIGDLFGNALAVGNFDGDRYSDLSVGVQSEDIDTKINAGAVNVLQGASTGLTGRRNKIWFQDTPGVLAGSEKFDNFGSSLATGDFNGDGRDDLAIGVSGEDLGSIKRAGGVNLLLGSRNGLTATNDQFWSQNSPGVSGGSEQNDNFGSSLASGDFNGDGKDDLAIGSRGEDIGSITNAGSVNILQGSSLGLTAANDQFWSQKTRGVLGGPEQNDNFGSSLATGDFNGDGRDDLAIGVSGEDIGSISNAGSVNVLFGSRTGLTAKNDQFWSQDSSGVFGGSEQNDNFGSSLATGDFNGDGRDDLAIGVSGEDIGNIINAGGVNVLLGSTQGLSATNDEFWSQDSFGILGGSERSDGFGTTLAVGDFNGDGKDDLAIGSPGEDIGSITDAGAVNILYGSNSGLTNRKDQIWHQNISGVKGVAEAYDRFGSSLSAGDFNGDGLDDLAIGVSHENIGGVSNGGQVQILFGSRGGLIA